jgi:prepilin-type N-terminal cleavage/methylation domain-containing protein
MVNRQKNKKNILQKGFSLIELSIVIIILGLLVASVTVGQDLIKAAELRAVISQLQGFDTQVGTFRLKYNEIPGDISNANKRGLGTNNGNGDGVLDDAGIDGIPNDATGEIVFFWEHLTNAGFADSSYDGDATNGKIGETFPKARHGGGVTAYGINGVNYYHVGITNSTPSGPQTFRDTFIPEDAFSVDSKIDDGFPLKGRIIARSTSCGGGDDTFSCANTPIDTISLGATVSPSSGTACVIQAGGSQDFNLDEYDFDTSTLQCSLRVQMN